MISKYRFYTMWILAGIILLTMGMCNVADAKVKILKSNLWSHVVYTDDMTDDKMYFIWYHADEDRTLSIIKEKNKFMVEIDDDIVSAYDQQTKVIVRVDKNKPITFIANFRQYDIFKFKATEKLINQLKAGQYVVMRVYYRKHSGGQLYYHDIPKFSLNGFTFAMNWLKRMK